MDIVFMGTPEFAVPCLEKLISDGHNVKGVFTQPDKPKGRGHKIQFPPVKICALNAGIPVYQPLKMRDGEAMSVLEELKPELIIVVAYGKILPKEILEFPKYGCVNIHASLLPKYRGAAPIQWAVLNGEKSSGVTSIQMDVGLDTGDMLLKAEVEIDNADTAGDLHDKLSVLGADVMSETIDLIAKNELKPVKQDDSLSNYAPMLSKDLCPIDWNESAENIHNKVRGLSPWPVAITTLGDKTLKVHKTKVTHNYKGKPGEVVCIDKKLVIACADSAVEIITLQLEGKKAMSAVDFMRGNPIEIGTMLK